MNPKLKNKLETTSYFDLLNLKTHIDDNIINEKITAFTDLMDSQKATQSHKIDYLSEIISNELYRRLYVDVEPFHT